MPRSKQEVLADPERVFGALGMAEAAEAAQADWAVSQASFDPDGIFFLEPAYLRDACRTLGMDGELAAAFQQALPVFGEHPELRRLAWHWHCMSFPASGEARGSPRDWPKLPEAWLERAGLLHAIVMLSGLPKIRAFHQAKGISDDISRDTFSDLALWLHHHHERNGHWGFAQMGWLSLHFTGQLYKLGRLQFNFGRSRYDFHTFRHVRQDRLLMLAGQGMRFRGDGFFDGTNGISDPETAWDAELTVTDRVIRGHPVSPARGIVRREPIDLAAADWREVLGQNDPILGVHIPATGPMDHASSGESFQRAVRFFGEHFPEYHFRAFQCTSWLLDPQFQDTLAPASNIVRFLQEYYLFPYPKAGDWGHFSRVFGEQDIDLDRAPRDTSLRRAILDFAQAGNHWHAGGGLIFPDHVGRWGEQVYRAMEP